MLESIIEQFALSVADVTHELGEALDGIEDRVLSDRSGDERRDLGKLRRRAVRMHRPLKALRRVIGQFEQRHAQRSHAMVAVAARLLQRFDELDNDIVVIQDRAKLLHDEVSAKLTDQTNRQLYFLSILTGVVPAADPGVGVFGMNTKGLPLTDDPGGDRDDDLRRVERDRLRRAAAHGYPLSGLSAHPQARGARLGVPLRSPHAATPRSPDSRRSARHAARPSRKTAAPRAYALPAPPRSAAG